MSRIVVKRPPRSLPRQPPGEPVALLPPPELPKGQQEGILMQLMPMMGMGSSVVFFFMPNAHPFMRIMGMLMLVSTISMLIAMIVRFRRGSQGQMAQLRRDYLKYLARTRHSVRETARRQRDAQHYLHPAPEQLWALVAEGGRVWERRPGEADFGQVRVGLGEHQLATPLVAPQTAPVEELEPLTAGALRRFLDVHSTVQGLPMAVSLRGFYRLSLSGDPETARGVARSLVASLTALHSPEDLTLAVVASPEAAPHWEWTKWLPHIQLGALDGAGSRRLFGGAVPEVERELTARLDGRGRFSPGGKPVLDQPHVVLLLDGDRIPPHSAFATAEGLQGVTIVEVLPGAADMGRGGLSVTCRPGLLRLQAPGGDSVFEGEPDVLPPAAAEALARQLAPLRISTAADDDEPLLAELDFGDLLGLGDPASVEVSRTWRPRSAGERLRVPIGVDEDGQPVMLDLKEAAQEGMGPHGLCVGATGSGKSELLRTLVLGLAVTHTSETLNFVLADFKGGATFTGMAGLPHVSAVITNLADDLSLVDRMGDSIRGELQRRQELLRAAGNYANLHDYERARVAGALLEPLPSLVLVIDEFSELLTAKPDFIEMFIQIGRIGRSLGVHLLLASQRLEEGRLRGLDTYLSYRIALRTFSAAESRTAIGTPDAYQLPQVPGSGLLKTGTEEMTRFKAAYVSGPYREPSAQPASAAPGPRPRRPVLFTAAPVAVPPDASGPDTPTAAPPAAPDDALADTVLDVVVRRLEGQGPAAHQVWLPPLDASPTMDQLMPDLRVREGRGLQASDRPGGLVVPLGVVDKPFEQRRETLLRDFSGAGGHMMIVGGPQSGKSTVLRALITSFALTHTPRHVQFYALDFGGGGLTSLADLPHVGGVASRLDPDRVRRTVSEVAGVLGRREEFFRRRGIDSIATFRRLRESGELPDQPFGDVFLVIDGWATFKQDYDMTLVPLITDLAARGLGYGIHVVATGSRYFDFLGPIRDQLANRLELRLGDPMDSEFDRKVAAAVPVGLPGRGQTPEKLHWLSALSRVDGDADPDSLAQGTADMVRAVREAWEGPSAPPVRMLPERLDASELPKGHERPGLGVAIGVSEADLEPVYLDFEQEPFLLVLGEGESGKTAALRLLMKQICERYTPDQARLLVGDYRRSLLGSIPESHVGTYASMAPKLTADMKAVRQFVEKRLPPADITPQQLRAGRWWTGPMAFVVIDDFELVGAGSGHPLSQLVEILPYARDTGVRFIIARSSSGAARGMFEPFTQRVRELGAQGLVLSADRSEGEILPGVRARRLPPGRATLMTRRRGTQLIQVGWLPEE
jgi:S-DNA-T family DNA segregation ATPase FtsK/SpoIIIE